MDYDLLLAAFIFLKLVCAGADNVAFSQDYRVIWGADHVLVGNDEAVQISLDKASGAGFESIKHYGSGIFTTSLKIPDKNSSGVITAFYLTSRTNNHDEVDMEFMGSHGPPYSYTLYTNLFLNGVGGREQRLNLWFDPTKDFHKYTLVWNHYRILWLVDGLLVRVYENKETHGAGYVTQAMQLEGSIWNGENWAGTKIDWSQAPFTASYDGLDIQGCVSSDVGVGDCYSSKYPWNGDQFKTLSNEDVKNYQMMRSNFLSYDYCEDRSRYPQPPIECRSSKINHLPPQLN